MVCPEGIEPPTHSLEGCCSIQLSYGQRSREIVVGAKGFEPSTLWSQTRCATRLRYAPTCMYCNGCKPPFPGNEIFIVEKTPFVESHQKLSALGYIL